ncbi:MAG TPA: hypothetical protein VJ761_11215 [Ktedonobacteraceae bacterium]|nr:hypothetical protein [Ktedonobacteraceae bacterium]
MIYYRVALQTHQTTNWRWSSTVVTSLEAVLGLIKLYSRIPKDHIRVFFSSSVEKLNEMLARENEGLTSNSMTAEQFLSGKSVSRHDMVRLEAESSTREKKVAVPASVVVAKAVDEMPGSMHGPEINVLDIRRLEVEPGIPGDHDMPYQFSLPTSMPQTLAWLRLMLRVQSGELEP